MNEESFLKIGKIYFVCSLCNFLLIHEKYPTSIVVMRYVELITLKLIVGCLFWRYQMDKSDGPVRDYGSFSNSPRFYPDPLETPLYTRILSGRSGTS